MEKKQVSIFLKNSKYFSNFTTKEIQILLKFFKYKKFKNKEVVFNEGEIGDEFYIIKKGIVDICKKSYLGDRSVAKILEGDIFGEMSVIDNMPRSASAKADTECELICIKKTDFYKLKSKHPNIAVKFLDILLDIIAKRLRETTSKIL